EEYRNRGHGRRVAIAQGVEDLDRQRLQGEAYGHIGDDILVERQHEREGVAGDEIGQDQRQYHRSEHHAVVGAHGRGSLDQGAINRGETQRQRDQRQGHEEDRVADYGRPGLAVKAERGPEGEQAERGNDRGQDERRDAEQTEDVGPGGDPPPQEPGERQRDQHGERG